MCRPGGRIASVIGRGPGKTDPGDAIAVAQVVLRKRGARARARARAGAGLALLELQRRRLVRDRTQAIQRLRADWNQVYPVGEARVANLTSQRELKPERQCSVPTSEASRFFRAARLPEASLRSLAGAAEK
jgi:Transposase